MTNQMLREDDGSAHGGRGGSGAARARSHRRWASLLPRSGFARHRFRRRALRGRAAPGSLPGPGASPPDAGGDDRGGERSVCWRRDSAGLVLVTSASRRPRRGSTSRSSTSASRVTWADRGRSRASSAPRALGSSTSSPRSSAPTRRCASVSYRECFPTSVCTRRSARSRSGWRKRRRSRFARSKRTSSTRNEWISPAMLRSRPSDTCACSPLQDTREAFAAKVEKRKPRFVGR